MDHVDHELTAGPPPLPVTILTGFLGAGKTTLLNRILNGDHAKLFRAWSYETDQALSLEALRQAASKLPAKIYRAKGVIHTSDAPTRRAVLQVVGRRVDITLEDEWRGRPPRTQIVAIGAAGAIDGEELRAAFERCADAQSTSSESQRQKGERP